MVKFPHLSEAAKRSWQDPEVRARRLAAIAKGKGQATLGRPPSLTDPRRLMIYLEADQLEALTSIARLRQASVSAQIRAYIDFGLDADKALLEPPTTCDD